MELTPGQYDNLITNVSMLVTDVKWIKKKIEGNGNKGLCDQQQELEARIEVLERESSQKQGSENTKKYVVALVFGNGVFFAAVAVIIALVLR